MNSKRMLKLVGGGILITLIWFAWPVYEFYAHRGEIPLPPLGWLEVEDSAPAIQELGNPKYREAGDRALDIIVKHRVAIGAPALSAAVSVDGELVWAGATGWADIRSKSPATPQTIFRIGSTSKALTATALARLIDKEQIDLDTPISHYLSDIPNPAWADITPRQLASHTAGLPHYKENRDWVGLFHSVALQRHYRDVRAAVEVFDKSPLLYTPGTTFYYSSLGIVLLGAVMSEAAGKPYRELMRDEVFEPLDMTSTIVAPKRAPKKSPLATFYYRRDNQYREWRSVDLSHRLPGGGFASTPSDLVRLGAGQLDEKYISRATREVIWTPQRLTNGKVNEQQYAIGWRWREWKVDGVGLVRNANHGGVSRGAQSWLLVFPDYNMSIAFTINSKTQEFHDFGHVYEDIFREFALAVAPKNSARSQ